MKIYRFILKNNNTFRNHKRNNELSFMFYRNFEFKIRIISNIEFIFILNKNYLFILNKNYFAENVRYDILVIKNKTFKNCIYELHFLKINQLNKTKCLYIYKK